MKDDKSVLSREENKSYVSKRSMKDNKDKDKVSEYEAPKLDMKGILKTNASEIVSKLRLATEQKEMEEREAKAKDTEKKAKEEGSRFYSAEYIKKIDEIEKNLKELMPGEGREYQFGDRVVQCWKCHQLNLVGKKWEAIECSNCRHYCRLELKPNHYDEAIHTSSDPNDYSNETVMPCLFTQLVCPHCKAYNKVLAYADKMTCLVCKKVCNIIKPVKKAKEKYCDSYDPQSRYYKFQYKNDPDYPPIGAYAVSDLFFPDPVMYDMPMNPDGLYDQSFQLNGMGFMSRGQTMQLPMFTPSYNPNPPRSQISMNHHSNIKSKAYLLNQLKSMEQQVYNSIEDTINMRNQLRQTYEQPLAKSQSITSSQGQEAERKTDKLKNISSMFFLKSPSASLKNNDIKMDYLNKFNKFVQKSMPNIKNPFDKGDPNASKDTTTHYTNPSSYPSSIEPNEQSKHKMFTMTTISSSSPNTTSGNGTEKKSSSLSAFLLAEKKPEGSQPASSSNSSGNVIAYNPFTVSAKREAKPDDDFMKDFTLIRGETIAEWEKCEIRIDDIEYPCKALITSYRITCFPIFPNESTYPILFPSDYFSIPIHSILTCEKTIDKRQTFKYLIEIVSKDNKEMDLLFRVGQNETFYFCLSGLMQSRETPSYSVFAIKYAQDKKFKENGWELYNPEKEFARQGLHNLDNTIGRGKLFRKTLLNENFSLCETYPQFLITSGQLTDEDIKMASAYRTKNRLPSLSYFFYQNTGSIWRCSQNKSGITNARNEYDERLVSTISTIGSESKIKIFDARPYLSAYANKLKGAGFENVDNYSQAEIIFCEIDNIHAARSSLGKIYSMLSQAKFYENKNFLSTFEATKWPEFIYLLIKSSINIAIAVKQGNSALIHCSDGWDRASQLTAFAQLLIDPYFRTLRGYMILIEKDFLSFGHQFKYRNGYYSQAECHEDNNSPIFLQYLDATHQLLIQYPMYFEFNMDFLVFIAGNINSGKYGTFLYNHEKDRIEKDVKNKTVSIWSEVLEDEQRYINPFYDKKTQEKYFLIPQFATHKIRLWEEYFMRFSQMQLVMNYDEYVNENEKREKDSRLMSCMEYYVKQCVPKKRDGGEDGEKKKIDILSRCLKEMIVKSHLSSEEYNQMPTDVQEMIKEIGKNVVSDVEKKMEDVIESSIGNQDSSIEAEKHNEEEELK